MARKVRLEYPGAIYHVINRGNYRSWIFREEGAKRAFQSCLFEACGRSGWVVHAYVVMGNHFHLPVETPQGNLVSGMQWLQSTFANRFNKLRGERGHLFQGRYKALLVEEGDALAQVCHYIHLNPVRAGLVTAAALGEYRYSSYWYLPQPKERPAFLDFAAVLSGAGGLPDSSAGWQSYHRYLSWQAEEGPAGKNKTYVSMSRLGDWYPRLSACVAQGPRRCGGPAGMGVDRGEGRAAGQVGAGVGGGSGEARR